MILLASANTLPTQTASKEKASTTSLFYCVPEFSNLDFDGLPEADELLRELSEKLDGPNPEMLRKRLDRSESLPVGQVQVILEKI